MKKVLSSEKQLYLYSLLGFICFICIYLLDGIKLLTEGRVPLPPFGFIGLVISLVLLAPFFSIKRSNSVNIWIFIFYIFAICITLLSCTSPYFEWVDFWAFTKLFVIAPLVGYFTCMFLKLKVISLRLKTLVLSLFLILAIAVIFFHFNRSLFIETNYLRFSESILIVGIFLLTFVESPKYKIILTLGVLGILFLSDSRFVFFSFIIIAFTYFLLNSFKALFKLTFFILISFLIVLIFDPELLLESRFARLLIETSDDTSLTARSKLLSQGFLITEFYSISGKYAYYREYCNGCYAHNFLSLWFEFGVVGIGFILFIITVIFLGMVNSLKRILNKSLPIKVEIFYLLIAIHSIIGFLSSKHWAYFSLFLVLGMTFYILNNKDYSPSNTN